MKKLFIARTMSELDIVLDEIAEKILSGVNIPASSIQNKQKDVVDNAAQYKFTVKLDNPMCELGFTIRKSITLGDLLVTITKKQNGQESVLCNSSTEAEAVKMLQTFMGLTGNAPAKKELPSISKPADFLVDSLGLTPTTTDLIKKTYSSKIAGKTLVKTFNVNAERARVNNILSQNPFKK